MVCGFVMGTIYYCKLCGTENVSLPFYAPNIAFTDLKGENNLLYAEIVGWQ